MINYFKNHCSDKKTSFKKPGNNSISLTKMNKTMFCVTVKVRNPLNSWKV